MKHNIEADIEKLKKDNISFLLPLVEALTNSIQANAKNITITFGVDNNSLIKKISNYTIVDDGDGFTQENIDSFNTYGSFHKKKLGCKGVGRLTWLVVFDNVDIISLVNNQKITINFDKSYDAKVKKEEYPSTEHYTKIYFKNVTPLYYNPLKHSWKDRRDNADIDLIKEALLNEMLIMLYLENKKGNNITITLRCENQSKKISYEDILQFEKKTEKIAPASNPLNPVDFTIYYTFIDVKKPAIHYVADYRTVETRNPPTIPSELSHQNLIMLITSTVFDETVTDARTSFQISNEISIITPFTKKEIDDSTDRIYLQIFSDKYPEISKLNKNVIDKSIEEYPYLSKFIKQDDTLVKNTETVINKAQEKFLKAKNEIKGIFNDLLNQNEIDSDKFDEITKNISELQALELGEYIAFRQQLIEGMQKMLNKGKVNENKIHNLLMKMGITSKNQSIYDINLWLLDDKFMTFSYAASDKSMSSLKKALRSQESAYRPNIEPDISLFYSKPEVDEYGKANKRRDAVLIEIKGINTANKGIAISELPRNIKILRQNIPDIDQLWGYIITELDEDFIEEIEAQARYKKAFTNGHVLYYDYFGDPVNANIYITDIKSLLNDANSRNKIFLDILKK